MIKQEIYLEKYDWNVIVCHVANQEDVDEAMDLLSSIDCKGQPLLDAYDHISTDSSNKGLTYTNVSKKTSVVLICKSTSGKRVTGKTGSGVRIPLFPQKTLKIRYFQNIVFYPTK